LGSKESKWNPNAPILENMNSTSFPNDLYNGMRQQIAQVYSQFFNYSIERHMHGKNSSSHQSMEIKEMDFISSAYAFTSFKQVVKTATFMNGISATFMPMPIPSEKGSGLELEIGMKNEKGGNIFIGKGGALSDNGNYFIGGILEHLKSILVFTNPTTNSYKRFYVDPKFMTCGSSDKSNAIFIDTSMKENTKIVLTFPDATVNPFLAYSAVMAAGFDGIKKKTSPGEIVTERPGTMGSKERKKRKIEEFPRDIMSSIESLENDIDFIKGTIAPEILVDYLEQKAKEQRMGSMIPNPYEFDEYFHL
jgi:glutamine synthetase